MTIFRCFGALLGAMSFCVPAQAYTAHYVCLRNFYVSTTGSAASSCGSRSAPCASIGDAMKASGWSNNIGGTGTALRGGDCVNVEDGTYVGGGETWIYQGGSANDPTGYVAIVGAPNHGSKLEVSSGKCSGGILGFNYGTGAPYGSGSGSYTILDGFEIYDASNECQNYLVGSGQSGGQKNLHHIIIINNLVHGANNGGGIGMAGGDYYVIAGNAVHDNHSAWESGISVYEPAYLTPNDSYRWDTQTFHIQYLQNISYNNGKKGAESCAKSGGSNWPDTDGEGIIADDWQNAQRGGSPYSGRGLIQSNAVFNNGGRGIQVGPTSLNVTVDNNTAYNNNIDTNDCGTWAGEFHNQDSYDVIWTNNVAYAVPGRGTCSSANPMACRVAFLWGTTTKANDKNVAFSYNDTYGGAAGNCGPGNTVKVQTQNSTAECNSIVASNNRNKLNVNPEFADSSVSDFHLASSSALIHAGTSWSTNVYPDPENSVLCTQDHWKQPYIPVIGAYIQSCTSGTPCHPCP